MAFLRHVGLMLSATVSLALVSAFPSHAASAGYECDPSRDTDGVLVVFRDGGYGGECRAWSSPQASDLRWFEINDDVSSLKNRTASTLCFYSEASKQGEVLRVGPWEWRDGLPSSMDNRISSFDYC
ncbi:MULTISPECIES: peptidase inhibitor family I36 protein [Streptomyces]|uniref:peptidase inhibitor family I36 protein n=1 Tax=Streptomyces TaxID=1883 RepID=UPI00240D04D7|nr:MULTISPECIES: peptidase inhibitor family I36 protein [Streptomyces]WFB88539.1 peptidase inhibitor family I36 protein [Streptomyces olivaceus]WGK50680.1 peptidase inhibitor family I36 protein [Streptomyces sp. B146]